MRNLLIVSLSTLSLVGSCSKALERVSNKSKSTAQRISSSDQVAIRTPTNPDGGLITGKAANISTEEDLRRIATNSVLPIVFGESVAGINRNTTRQDAKAILSNPQFTTDSGIDIYGEGLQVTWGAGINPLPASIRIVEGYKGALTLPLPAPYQSVNLMQDLTPLFASDPSYATFTRAAGAAFAGKDAAYDCLAASTCLIDNRGAEVIIDFPNGSLILFNNAIYLIDFQTNTGFTPVSAEPMLLDKSIAGLAVGSSKADVIKVLGEPYRYKLGEEFLFDARTIRIEFDAEDKAVSIGAVKGHKGKLTIGTKDFSIGSSFKEFSTADDVDGLQLMQTLNQVMTGKDATFDCTKAEVNKCQSGHNAAEKWIKILVGATILEFSDDAERSLLSVTVFKSAE
ncbi:MAG: hypothetical protein EOP07_22390 [Proteobacteria bacterium]|nr:MAG: hypothetical protein EOP07_22390 [Pseudomonadota bacterium]